MALKEHTWVTWEREEGLEWEVRLLGHGDPAVYQLHWATKQSLRVKRGGDGAEGSVWRYADFSPKGEKRDFNKRLDIHHTLEDWENHLVKKPFLGKTDNEGLVSHHQPLPPPKKKRNRKLIVG